MSVKLHSAQTVGLEGRVIDVEVDYSKGLRSFTIVGLADKSVDEAKERISYAVKNIGLKPPHKQNQKVIVSLAPADLKKEGSVFDLAIALGYLTASKQLEFNPTGKMFFGELALDGSLRPVKGVLPLALKAKKEGFKEVFLPEENGDEARFVDGLKIYGAKNLTDILDHLQNEKSIPERSGEEFRTKDENHPYDFADIKGQDLAKRALTIASAGGHNVAMTGPPGTGKTLLARTIPSILPPLTKEESLETTAIHSVAGTLTEPFITQRPFRSPHHTSSYVALIGGGTWPKPGEVTLAHRGVLFADEFPEFDRKVIESLRQPLEDGVVTVSRAKGTMRFPARFMLVAAMNPCPCGNHGSKTKECSCSPSALSNYQRKISGPIADRIDLWMEIGQVDHEDLSKKSLKPESQKIKEKVIRARDIQKNRYAKPITNSELSAGEIEKFIPLGSDERKILNASAKQMDLSARAYHRVIKIARTIADLEESKEIQKKHIMEALQYRPKSS